MSRSFASCSRASSSSCARSAGRRPSLEARDAALSLVGLSLALVAYVLLGGYGTLVNVALFGLVGALLFGPDALLSGASAQDAGGPHAAAMATGFVNGVGSLGWILEGLLVPPLVAAFGWGALFPVLVVLALAAALALAPTLRGPVAAPG